jgi:hypothetical protein
MSALINVLYREFCRIRIEEMRKVQPCREVVA